MLIATALLWSACAPHRATVQLPASGKGGAPDWVDLQPGMELRVEGAYYREGTPRIGLADYLGSEIARYEVTPRGALRLVSVSSFVTEQRGKTQPRDQPAVNTLVRRRDPAYRHHRLFFQVVMSRNRTIRPAILPGARSAPAPDSVTRRFMDGQHSPCGAIQSDQCTTFPPMITASLDVGITVNGTTRKVVWGTSLGTVTAHSARNVQLKRLTKRHIVSIPIHPSDPATMRTPLLQGDEIRWE